MTLCVVLNWDSQELKFKMNTQWWKWFSFGTHSRFVGLPGGEKKRCFCSEKLLHNKGLVISYIKEKRMEKSLNGDDERCH